MDIMGSWNWDYSYDIRKFSWEATRIIDLKKYDENVSNGEHIVITNRLLNDAMDKYIREFIKNVPLQSTKEFRNMLEKERYSIMMEHTAPHEIDSVVERLELLDIKKELASMIQLQANIPSDDASRAIKKLEGDLSSFLFRMYNKRTTEEFNKRLQFNKWDTQFNNKKYFKENRRIYNKRRRG